MTNFRVILILCFIFIATSSFAVGKDSSSLLWYEGNIIYVSSKAMPLSELFSFYQNTPDYSQSDEYHIGFQNRTLRRDTLLSVYEFETNPKVYLDFRNNVFGFQRNIRDWNRVKLNHSIAVSFSREDSKYWGRPLRSYLSTNMLTFDSLNRPSSAYIVNKKVDGYRQTRRLGFAYQNSLGLEVFKWFRLDLALRHTFYLKYKDRLFLQETIFQDTVTYDYDNISGIGDWEVNNGPCYVCFRFSDLYDKEKPTSAYTEHKGKPSLQYDTILHLKPTLVLGKQKKVELYLTAGALLGTAYGKQFWKGQGGIMLGSGIGYKL